MDNHFKKCSQPTSKTSRQNESHQGETIPLPEFGNITTTVLLHDPDLPQTTSPYLGMVPNHGGTIQGSCQGQPLPEQATAPYLGMVPNHGGTIQGSCQGQPLPEQATAPYVGMVPNHSRSPYIGMVPNHSATRAHYVGCQLPPTSYVPVVLPQARSPYLGMVPCNHGEQSQAPFQAQPQMYQAPAQDPRMQQRLPSRNWSTGLFSCFDEISSCALGTFCPCFLAMTISCSVNECCCTGNCYPVALRTSIRKEYNIMGSICEDAYVMCWCYQCGLCQIAREIDVVASELETTSQSNEQKF